MTDRNEELEKALDAFMVVCKAPDDDYEMGAETNAMQRIRDLFAQTVPREEVKHKLERLEAWLATDDDWEEPKDAVDELLAELDQ